MNADQLFVIELQLYYVINRMSVSLKCFLWKVFFDYNIFKTTL